VAGVISVPMIEKLAMRERMLAAHKSAAGFQIA
jgi:hypothetical protein